MRGSKLQFWCEGVLEAGWLAALVVSPLFFNTYSNRVFEPDKIALVRSIALVMLAAYLLKLADGGRAWLPAVPEGTTTSDARAGASAPTFRTPLLLPVLLLIAAEFVSTVLSVAPSVSWSGSYERLQGTWTFSSYLAIGLLAAAHLRKPAELHRLQHAVILTSLPVSLYAVVQHFGMDPFPWAGNVVDRVAANAGNPIFLSAYLIFAFFLTLERTCAAGCLLRVFPPRQTGGEARPGRLWTATLVCSAYGAVLVLQVAAIAWTRSRGPWLGLAAGGYFFGLLLLSVLRLRRRRLWIAGWVGLSVGAAAFLIVISMTELRSRVEEFPYLDRLATVLDTNYATNRVRLLIWDAAADIVVPHEPVVYPGGRPDAWNSVRPLVGYGPEAMSLAYSRFFRPDVVEIEGSANQDRAHNETWDILTTTGLVGLAAFVSVFAAVVSWSLRWLGLIVTRRDHHVFLGLWFGGGSLLTAFVCYYDQSWRLLGLTLPGGFLAGFFVYVVSTVMRGRATPPEDDGPRPVGERRRQVLLVTILAALIAHFVEIQFGIPGIATRIHFYVLTALLLALGMRWLRPEPLAAAGETGRPEETKVSADRKKPGRQGRADARKRWFSSLPRSVMPDLLVMLTLVFLFTTNFPGLSAPADILASSVMTRMSGGQPVGGVGVLLMLTATGFVAATLGLSTAAMRRSKAAGWRWWLGGYTRYCGVLFAGWWIYGLIQARRLAPVAGMDLETQLDRAGGHFGLYTWLAVAWMIAAGLVLAWPHLGGRRFAARALPSLASLAVAGIASFSVISTVNVALVRADVFYKQGRQFSARGDWLASADQYRRALVVRPAQDHYIGFLGSSLLELAKRAPEGSRIILSENRTFEDMLRFSADEFSRMGKNDLLASAELVFLEGQRLNPLHPDHTANLGRLYWTWADSHSNTSERLELLEKSRASYEAALTLSPNLEFLPPELGGALFNLALLYRELEQSDRAASLLERAAALQPRNYIYFLQLAQVYSEMGEAERAKGPAERALTLAPESEKPWIEEFISAL